MDPMKPLETAHKVLALLLAAIGIVIVAAIVFLVLSFWPSPAEAQASRNCAPREAVVGRLARDYGETRQSMGLGTNNQLVEVFASDETGTWTITVTTPSGVTCLVASGQAFEALAEALPIEGDET